ncbi:hypothetical protein [Borrelia coriaceae]|uniref:hypothetical protein n=1 Tax=Borrelia coriaceae TaxID=144 RepID=UPI0004816804|nr:hypothetical protein [Borrelia coriaceae]
MIKILVFLTIIINLYAISEEEKEQRKKFDKYEYEKRKLVRVKNWKTNFKNLKNLGTYFTDEIENIKSKSDKELRHGFQFAFSISLCVGHDKNDDIVPKEYKSLFEKSYKFIQTLKKQNPEQAAYLIHEIYELDKMFTFTKEIIDMFNYAETQEFIKRYNKYKHIFIKLKDIYSKAKQEYFNAFNILNYNDINDNFCKFMLKFVEIHKLASHVYFNMEYLLHCAGNRKPESINPYCTKLTSTT